MLDKKSVGSKGLRYFVVLYETAFRQTEKAPDGSEALS